MPIIKDRYLWLGLAMALLTALTATLGSPDGLEELTVPVWDILLQFNLCSAFVFIIIGVLRQIEIPLPEMNESLRLLVAAFSTYITAMILGAAGLELGASLKLFLFSVALACILTAWAAFGVTILKRIDL